MPKKYIQNAMLLAIIVLSIAIIAYGYMSKIYNYDTTQRTSVNFNASETKYIESNESITIHVDSELEYLIGDSNEGYLNEYLATVLKPAGLDFTLVTGDEQGDCDLVVVSGNTESNNEEVNFTVPLFEVKGGIFINKSTKNSQQEGLLLKNRLSDRKASRITIDGEDIKYRELDSSSELLETAKAEDVGYIIGDTAELKALGIGATSYILQEEEVYKFNVCIITDKNHNAMYSVINDCLQASDRHSISAELAEKYLNAQEPVFMEKNDSDVYFLILVMFAAVLVAFFVYYAANRNMYEELNNRMIEINEGKNELQTTFNGVKYLLAELDTEGKILDANKAFIEYKQENIIGEDIWNVIHLNEKSLPVFMQMIEYAKEGLSGDYIDIKFDQKVFSIAVFPIEGVQNKIDKLLFLGMDVTGERMAERQILQDNKMIAVGQLASGIAHEIRNPLGIIRNYCYVLKTIDDENVRKNAIQQIEQSIDDSSEIINNLLNFSRINTGMVSEIDIKEHIEMLVSVHSYSFKKKDIEVLINERNAVITSMNKESFTMIIQNLMLNAVDAMDVGGKLEFTIDKSRDYFMVSVSDNGSGIKEEYMEEIFNPFFTTKGKNGTGLGLYIVYTETEKLNGNIEVESTYGEGTTFKVTIPRT